MFDMTKFLTDSFLQDFQDKPINIVVKNLSDKYDIVININTHKKEEK